MGLLRDNKMECAPTAHNEIVYALPPDGGSGFRLPRSFCASATQRNASLHPHFVSHSPVLTERCRRIAAAKPSFDLAKLANSRNVIQRHPTRLYAPRIHGNGKRRRHVEAAFRPIRGDRRPSL